MELGISEQRLDACPLLRTNGYAGRHSQKNETATSKQAHRSYRISLTISWRSLGTSMGGLLKGPWRSLW